MANNENSIKDFDHKAFADDLAGQAKELVPKDLTDEDKKFVMDVVHDFTFIAGDAIKKDKDVKLNANEAILLSQIIGEWTFHKSIDLVRGNIDSNLRKPVLEKVAFTIYEIGKHALAKQMPQEKIIDLVEFHVKKSFKAAIDEMVSKNIIKDDIANSTLSQSNIDTINQAQIKQEQENLASIDDTKKVKLASLAYLIKDFSKEKIRRIISKFNQEEAAILVQYLNVKDFESKFSPVVAANYLKDMKKHLPEPQMISYDRCYMQLCKIVKNSEKNKIEGIIKEERPKVQKYVLSAYDDKKVEMPAMVADIICKHLKEKVLL